MITEYSKEIQAWIKSKLLRPGDKVTVTWPETPRAADLGTPKNRTSEATFKGFTETYRGRLLTDSSQHGAEPGKYRNRSRVWVEVETIDDEGTTTATIDAPLDDIKIDEQLLEERLAAANNDIHFISLAPDKLYDLPDTLFMEGDTVALTDKDHPNYKEDNQFTVYRVSYSYAENDKHPTQYKLRAGARQFWAKEEQLVQLAPGPVRLFYSGEGYKLLWPSAKAEAEFYVLLGRFNKVYNPTAKSYYWPLEDAKQLVNIGKAHAILQHGLFEFYLLNFWDLDVVSAIAGQPDLILDI